VDDVQLMEVVESNQHKSDRRPKHLLRQDSTLQTVYKLPDVDTDRIVQKAAVPSMWPINDERFKDSADVFLTAMDLIDAPHILRQVDFGIWPLATDIDFKS
jgi:hypothetical protein